LAVLVVPLVINLWLWLSPRVSIRPLLEWVRSFDPQTWDQAREQIVAAVTLERPIDLRLLGPMRLWQPIYLFQPPANVIRPIDSSAWAIDSLLTFGGVLVAINLLVMLLTAGYLLAIADSVRGATPTGNWLRRVGRTWLSLMGVLAIVVTVLIVVGIPLMAVATALAALVPVAGYFVLSILLTVVFWMLVSASFAYDAVVLNGQGPLMALMSSLAVVRRFFWGVLGLWLMRTFMLAGLGIIWDALATSVLGVVVALVMSAYIGAGIAAAHLVFFRDRLPLTAAVPAR